MYDPAEHEPLTDDAFDTDVAQAFIVDTVRLVEAKYVAGSGWPLHPEDDYGKPKGAVDCSVFSGTAGSLWALTRLAERYSIELQLDPVREIERCEKRFTSYADGRTPSYVMGQAGVAFVHHLLTNDAGAIDRYMSAAAANVVNPTATIRASSGFKICMVGKRVTSAQVTVNLQHCGLSARARSLER